MAILGSLTKSIAVLPFSGFKPPAEVMPLALEAARKSLELDSNLAETHNAFACATLLYDRNYELAGTQFKAALNLNPQYPQAIAWYGLFFLHWVSGRDTDAREQLLRAIQIDPLSAYAHVIFSFYCSSSGKTFLKPWSTVARESLWIRIRTWPIGVSPSHSKEARTMRRPRPLHNERSQCQDVIIGHSQRWHRSTTAGINQKEPEQCTLNWKREVLVNTSSQG